MKRYAIWCSCHPIVKGNHAESRVDDAGEWVRWEDVNRLHHKLLTQIELFDDEFVDILKEVFK